MKIHGLDQKSYIFSLCCLVFMLVVTDNKPLFLPVVLLRFLPFWSR